MGCVVSLTPYDTGERAEPVIWVVPETGWIESTVDHRQAETDDWGKVDYNDSTNETVATIHVEHADGNAEVHVMMHGNGVRKIVIHAQGEDLPEIEYHD